MTVRVDDRLLVAMQKAALMVHWIPDLGLTIVQSDHPRIRVARWASARQSTGLPASIDLHPCELRRMVLQLADAGLVGSAQLIAGDPGSLRLEHFTGPSTKLGPHGMVRHQIDADHAMFGFASLLHPNELPLSAGDIEMSVDFDDELGASLVHRSFAVGDAVTEQRTFEMVYDAATTCAVDELVSRLAG